MRPFRRNEDAVSGVIAFLVAGGIFVASIGALILTTQDASDTSGTTPGETAALGLQAQALADLLVGSPGFATVGSALTNDWNDTSADELERLGLRSSGNATLDFVKFQNLRRAAYASANDNRVNYPDARTSLDLAQGDLDFHVRAFPSLESVRDLLATGKKDPNLRVAYLGDYTGVSSGGGSASAGLGVASVACAPHPTAGAYTLSAAVSNGGTTPAQFTAIFEMDYTGNSLDYVDRTRTYLVPPGSSATLALDMPAMAGRTCGDGELTVEVWDRNLRLHQASYPLPATAAASTVAKDLWMNPARPGYNQGDAVVLEFDGTLPTKNSDPSVTMSATVRRVADNAVVHSATFTVSRSVRSFTVPASAFDTSLGTNYVAELVLGSTRVSDPILVLPVGQTTGAFTPTTGTVSYQPTAPVPHEVRYIDQLVHNFCPYVFGTAAHAAGDTPLSPAPGSARCAFDRRGNPQQGDVFPDVRSVMNEELPKRLVDPAHTSYVQQCNGNIQGGPRYDWTRVLIVGSNVDHNSMTSGAAKYAVCEWVMGGGTLIVFGSADQQVQWLQPIFHAAIRSSSDPLAAPDASHPILNRADVLSYDAYDPRARAWSFNGQTEANQAELLTNVVTSGASGSVLSISNPGAFGDGTIILTTWLPYDLYNTGAGTSGIDGLKVVNNFLMQGYRDLFLDYGPTIPADSRQAAAAQRVTEIWHPEFDEPVTLTLFVYVF